MGKWDQFCQSCGMPLDQDPKGGGTEADGSKSTKYCSYCYQEGRFLGDIKTAKDMIRFVREELRRQGLPWYKRWFYTMHIPQLDRWKR